MEGSRVEPQVQICGDLDELGEGEWRFRSGRGDAVHRGRVDRRGDDQSVWAVDVHGPDTNAQLIRAGFVDLNVLAVRPGVALSATAGSTSVLGHLPVEVLLPGDGEEQEPGSGTVIDDRAGTDVARQVPVRRVLTNQLHARHVTRRVGDGRSDERCR